MKRFRTFTAAIVMTLAMGAGSAHAITRAEAMAQTQAHRESETLNEVDRTGAITGMTVSRFAGVATARQFVTQGRGANNAAAVVQNGDNNGAYVAQRGANNGVGIAQNNNNNRAYVAQIGRDLGLGVTQNGGNRTVIIQTQDRTIVREVR